MNTNASDLPAFYYDLQSLAPLKQAASENPEKVETLRKVAEQFESLFMQMVMKSMRSASLGESLFDSKQSLFYRDMFDQQLSVKMAGSGGMGLADLLVEQLSQTAAPTRPDPFSSNNGSQPASAPLHNVVPTPIATEAYSANLRDVEISREKLTSHSVVKAPVAQRSESSNGLWQRPQDFVRDIWPHAVAAAQELGVDPRVLVAQSALETGWGLKVPLHADGHSSFNLFGIKAGRDWSGDSVRVSTLEYTDEQFVREKSDFRAYSSIAEAMDDYVHFLRGHARYAGALENAADPESYSRALQRAGYATDPVYADKILRVMDSEPLAQGLAQVRQAEAIQDERISDV